MNRRLILSMSVLVVAGMATVPSQAATKKKAPVKGTYAVNLVSDPTTEALNTAGKDGCVGLSPAGKDSHPFTVPGAGKLRVVLDGSDASSGKAFDWDLYLVDADGNTYSSSNGPTAHEETTDVFKKKMALTIQVCNLIGTPAGTVSYTFTYT